MEEWKDIEGYEGYYKVSNIGKILRINKRKIISNVKYKTGYVVVHLSKNGNKKKALVHRLVAKAFVDNPYNKPEVNHIDGNKQNNFYKNLEWCTGVENKAHAVLNNLTCTGERNRNNTFSTEQILEIRHLNKIGYSQVEIARMFNTRQGTISGIILRKTWKHI